MRERTIRQRVPSIDFFAGGVKLDASATVDVKENDKRGVRGEIRGWSTASRRRMREFLLTHEPLPGAKLYGVTLTIPGDRWKDGKIQAPSPEECAKLFDHFGKNYVTRQGCGMVWRLEVQSRGVIHWHGILSAPATVYFHGVDMPPPCALRFWWLDALRVLGKHDFLQTWKGREVILEQWYHSDIPGAEVHSVDVQEDGGRGAWLRYLQDHATKSKQEQVAQNVGRHWGVVGRSQFRKARAEHSHQFSSVAAYWRFLRAFHRLTRPVMSYRKRREKTAKYNGRPFGGRSLGWSSNRGTIGVSVWFSKPETIKKLVAWAEGSPLVG